MLIDRGDALAVVQHNRDPIEGLKNLPAVDAVEVVRCGECEFIDDKCAHGIVCICDHGGMCGTFVADTDFCSCGKRRMDGE